jgi:Predicted thioesterase
MEKALQCGLTAKAEKTVRFEAAARAVLSELSGVFATPCMIALMACAAVGAVQPHLPPGRSTVGVRVDAQHTAATPIGLKVWAQAERVAVDGRRLTFDITAWDEQEKIGEAQHTRVIVDAQKFAAKAAAKAQAKA